MCLDQLGLGIGWPHNENRAGVGNRFRYCLKEGVILRGVTAPDGACLMVDVPGQMIRVQREPFDVRRAEMEYPCFMVIDSNNRMIVRGYHGMSPFDQPADCSGGRERGCRIICIATQSPDHEHKKRLLIATVVGANELEERPTYRHESYFLGRLRKAAVTSFFFIRAAGLPRSPRFCSSVPSPIMPG